MPRYIVYLEWRLGGSAAGSTRDEIEAETSDAAVEAAIAAWRKADPRYTYAPLRVVDARLTRSFDDASGFSPAGEV